MKTFKNKKIPIQLDEWIDLVEEQGGCEGTRCENTDCTQCIYFSRNVRTLLEYYAEQQNDKEISFDNALKASKEMNDHTYRRILAERITRLEQRIEKLENQ